MNGKGSKEDDEDIKKKKKNTVYVGVVNGWQNQCEQTSPSALCINKYMGLLFSLYTTICIVILRTHNNDDVEVNTYFI